MKGRGPQRGDLDGKHLRVGVVVSRFNPTVTDRLLEGALEALEKLGVGGDRVEVISVPGAFEIPLAASKLARSKKLDAVVCLGAVIRGETEHATFVSKAVQEGVARASYDLEIPMTFGVLTTDTEAQALARAGGTAGNRGYDAAVDAVEMANLVRGLS